MSQTDQTESLIAKKPDTTVEFPGGWAMGEVRARSGGQPKFDRRTVNTYSEAEEFRALLLSDVIVYYEAGYEVSKAPALYLSRPKNCSKRPA